MRQPIVMEPETDPLGEAALGLVQGLTTGLLHGQQMKMQRQQQRQKREEDLRWQMAQQTGDFSILEEQIPLDAIEDFEQAFGRIQEINERREEEEIMRPFEIERRINQERWRSFQEMHGEELGQLPSESQSQIKASFLNPEIPEDVLERTFNQYGVKKRRIEEMIGAHEGSVFADKYTRLIEIPEERLTERAQDVRETGKILSQYRGSPDFQKDLAETAEIAMANNESPLEAVQERISGLREKRGLDDETPRPRVGPHKDLMDAATRGVYDHPTIGRWEFGGVEDMMNEISSQLITYVSAEDDIETAVGAARAGHATMKRKWPEETPEFGEYWQRIWEPVKQSGVVSTIPSRDLKQREDVQSPRHTGISPQAERDLATSFGLNPDELTEGEIEALQKTVRGMEGLGIETQETAERQGVPRDADEFLERFLGVGGEPIGGEPGTRPHELREDEGMEDVTPAEPTTAVRVSREENELAARVGKTLGEEQREKFLDQLVAADTPQKREEIVNKWESLLGDSE